MSKRFGIEQVPFLAAPRWVSHHSRCTTSKHHRPVTQHLESTQTDLAKQVAHVQRI
jgi:hypothetical protein